MSMRRETLGLALAASVTKTASYAADDVVCNPHHFRELIVTLDVASAAHASDETYDLYVTSGDGVSAWDVVHFPQIATTGAKRYTARVLADRLAEVSAAAPGVAAECSATLATIAAGSGNGIKTLAAGSVRHGPFGDRIGYQLVVAGSGTTSIVYSIQVQGA